MKPGNAVELSARSRRLKSGNWQVHQKEYKIGTVIKIEPGKWAGDEMVTVLWNNGTLHREFRSDIKYIKDCTQEATSLLF